MKEIILTHSTEETELAGAEFAKTLSRGDFVAMRGDLGVGRPRLSAVWQSTFLPKRACKVLLIR